MGVMVKNVHQISNKETGVHQQRHANTLMDLAIMQQEIAKIFVEISKVQFNKNVRKLRLASILIVKMQK
jgi:hypothetical protein